MFLIHDTNKPEKGTELEDIVYSLHLYFNGLSLLHTYKAISRFVTISHTAIRDWMQKFKPERLFHSKNKISKFIVDETQIKVGSEPHMVLGRHRI